MIVSQLNNGPLNVKKTYEYKLSHRLNKDPNYFVLVRTEVDPDEFRFLIAYIQLLSEKYIDQFYGLTELEIARVINDLYKPVTIMKTTQPLLKTFEVIDLFNYDDGVKGISLETLWQRGGEIINKQQLHEYLIDLSKKNHW